MSRFFVAAALVGLLMPIAARAADYVAVTKEVAVNRPADLVWKQVGEFCAIGPILKRKCEYAGPNHDVGATRKLEGGLEEVMVGKTDHSYTYHQTVGNFASADYHGTLSVEPSADGKTSKVVYHLVFDTAGLPADQRATTPARMGQVFQGVIDGIKAQVETK